MIEITKQGEGVTTVDYTGLLWKDGSYLPFTVRDPASASELTESQRVTYYSTKEIVATHRKKHGPFHRYFAHTSEGQQHWRVPKHIQDIT